MTNYREILRLHSLGLNKTEIASSLHCARNTVAATLQRAGNCGLQWQLPDEMSDKQLADLLFPSAPGKPVYKMPDYAYVYREMQKSGVTLNLLRLEYCDQCKASGEIPYQSTQFNKYYSDYLNKTNATMHLNHKPGEIMQVDWAGDTASVIDTDTGEVIPAYVFVATLPYSGYSYCDTAIVAEEGREIECAAEPIPMNAQIPNRRSGWGSVLDIEIYLNVTEPVHPAQGRYRIHIRFRIRLGNHEGSEHLKIT